MGFSGQEWVVISFSNWHWETINTGALGKKKTSTLLRLFSSLLREAGVGVGAGESPKALGRYAFSLSLLLSKERLISCLPGQAAGLPFLPRNASEQTSPTCPFPCRHQTSMGSGGEGREAELPSLTQHLGRFSAFSGSVKGKSGSETLWHLRFSE